MCVLLGIWESLLVFRNALSNEITENYSELVKELQRQLPINKIAETCSGQVSERVSIRDLLALFSAPLIDWAPREKDVLMLTEYKLHRAAVIFCVVLIRKENRRRFCGFHSCIENLCVNPFARRHGDLYCAVVSS